MVSAAVKEHGTPFVAAMVRAIRRDEKSETRRVVARGTSLVDGRPGASALWASLDFMRAWVDPGPSPAGNAGPYLKVPRRDGVSTHRVYARWLVGDRLWVREAWAVGACADGFSPRELDPRTWRVDNGGLWYPADDTVPAHPISPRGRTRPPMFMPRWASRVLLEVTDVRVQRLQEISEADAGAEGMVGNLRAYEGLRYAGGGSWVAPAAPDYVNGMEPSRRAQFAALWDSLNVDRGFGWNVNPWVWVIGFRRIEA
jgi:hypothetical protein